jgi:hypothetical protein
MKIKIICAVSNNTTSCKDGYTLDVRGAKLGIYSKKIWNFSSSSIGRDDLATFFETWKWFGHIQFELVRDFQNHLLSGKVSLSPQPHQSASW